MESLYNPKQGMTRVLGWNLDRGSLWLAAVLVVIISVLLNGILVMIRPELLSGPQLIPTSPFLQTLVIWGGLVMSVYGAHFIGRMFGGTGEFDDSMHAMIWLQTIMLVFQAAQIVLMILSDGLGAMVSMAAFVLTVWLFVNFVALIHGFKSLWMVFAGFIASSIGLAFGLVIIYAVFAVLLGLEIQNV